MTIEEDIRQEMKRLHKPRAEACEKSRYGCMLPERKLAACDLENETCPFLKRGENGCVPPHGGYPQGPDS